MLEFILHDPVRGAHSGISEIGCKGKRCVVYIDVTGIVGDYPASSTVIDCMSHDANNTCTNCWIRILDGTGAKFKSVYAHSFTIHSWNTIFESGFDKSIALRKSNFLHGDCSNLGMNNGNLPLIQVPGRSPPLKIAYLLSNSPCPQKHQTKLNLFDPDSRNFISLDHLLTSLCSNLFDCCFFELKQLKFDQQLELGVPLALQNVGRKGELCIYRSKTNNLVRMSM